MDKTLKHKFFLVLMGLLACFGACSKVDDLAVPNVESPVLLLLSGTSFLPNAPVVVNGSIYELDKSGILDNTIGIDSIPINGLQIGVYVNHTTQVGSIVSDSNGRLVFTSSWADVGLSNPVPTNQVRLEFAGEYGGIAFRRYHTITVAEP